MVARIARVGSSVVDLIALPTITVTTSGGAPIVSLEDYVSCTVSISGPLPYSGSGQIRGRGNSTWDLPKKPYKLKLGSKASLLGMPSDKDWVLLANYYDASRVRGAVAFEMGNRCSGLTWTPRMRFVRLVVNGDPVGVYQLGEHVKVASSRINIDSMTSGNIGGLALTGGYSMEIDGRFETAGDPGFYTAHDNVPIAFDEPDGTVAAQATYIENWVNEFEYALYGNAWLDPATGYARFVDQASFIDWYLVEELCANTDSWFFSSCKLFKTRDTISTPGRLHMGPLWDFDLSMGLQFDDPTVRNPVGYYTRPGATWLDRMFSDPAFTAAVRTRWQALKTSIVTTSPIGSYADLQAGLIAQGMVNDQTRWSYTATDAAAIKTWLTARIAWLNSVLIA